MSIRMYNCYFGDCFKLNNNTGKPLLVDFGIHKRCVSHPSVYSRFDEVYQDIQSQELDFLLSHYHEDHYNGAVYINSNYSYKFKNVYIPDIWGIKGSVAAIQLHLLSSMLSMYRLNNHITIYSFLQKICDSTIHLIQRGSIIQERYIALWPSYEQLSEKADKVLSNALDKGEFNDNHLKELRELAEKTGETVRAYVGRNIHQETYVSRLENYNKRLSNLKDQMLDDNKANKLYADLHHFGNDISIVFQNKETTTNENVLFTGDFGRLKRDWTFIETNKDNNNDCNMHGHYNVIKVGHHGTRPYYHSFAQRIDYKSTLLIPNGDKKKAWNICSDYSQDASNKRSKIVCSTNWSCEVLLNKNSSNCTICPCSKKVVIESIPNTFYTDIP